jgi:hypothetical protein
MTTRTKVIILIAAIVLVIVGIVAFALQKPSSAPEVVPTASPTETPFADAALIERLSSELGAKYQTFTDSGSPAYFASLQPYVTSDLLNYIKNQSSRYAGRVAIFKPIRSTTSSVEVTGKDDHATATVHLSLTKLQTGQQLDQTLKIEWQKSGDRWTANNIQTTQYGN